MDTQASAKPIVPIAFKNPVSRIHDPIAILAADVGGTKTNVAYYKNDGGGLVIIEEKR